MLSFGLTACLSEPDAGAANAGMLVLRACDARGQAVALTHLPRQPRLLLEPSGSSESEDAPWLFTGTLDASLARDLSRLPLTAASQERLVPTRRTRVGRDLVLTLQGAPLRAGADYTLALPLSALTAAQAQLTQQKPWSAALHVELSASAGAAVRGSYPESGAADVSPQLTWAAVSFDGEIRGMEDGLWVEDAAGYAIAGTTEASACEALDTAAVSCIRWTPSAPLSPETSYTLRSGQSLHDAHDAELQELRSDFTTAAVSGETQTLWQAATCAVDEQALPTGCARVLDDRIVLRLSPSPSARVGVALNDRRFAALPRREGVQIALTDLDPDTEQHLTISAFDAEQREQRDELVLRTAAALPTLTISEVYADPAGKEPDQEFVELWNYGPRALPLSGLYLSDSLRELGQRIESEVSLAPGGHALLVSDAFSSTSALDVPPRAGSVLVRLGKALTPNGLSNRGEALYLRDAAGHRLSTAPDRPAPQTGHCVTHIGSDPRAEDPESFSLEETCTPGS